MKNYCTYSKCKAVAEYETAFGELCPYHFKVLNKKKGLTGKKIEISKTLKKILKDTRINPDIQIKLGRNK